MASPAPSTPHRNDTSGRVRLKGLFADGVWRCNCEPARLPAVRLETKNGGKNHGRWFYKCQKTLPQGCNFFLWDDDAKAREAGAVLSNSRTEPSTPRHASRPFKLMTPPKPSTPSHANVSSAFDTSPMPPPSRSRPTTSMRTTSTSLANGLENTFESHESHDKATALADSAPTAAYQTDRSRKAVKTDKDSSPGKHQYGQLEDRIHHSQRSPSPSPQTRNGMRASSSIMPSPEETPRALRFRQDPLQTPTKYKGSLSYPVLTPASSTAGFDASPSKSSSSRPSTPTGSNQDMEKDVLAVLQDASVTLLPQDAARLREVCEKYARRAKAFESGRNDVRKILQQRNADLVRSNERILALEAELDVQRRMLNRVSKRESTVDSETTQATTVVWASSDYED